MIAWTEPRWWSQACPAPHYVEFAKQAGEAVGRGIVPGHFALKMLHAAVRDLHGGPPEFPPFGRWKNCACLKSLTRVMRLAARVAAADMTEQEMRARKLIGPMLARGADRGNALALVKRECPDLSGALVREIVDQEAAWWVRYRHDLDQSSINRADAECDAEEAAWRLECYQIEMEVVIG